MKGNKGIYFLLPLVFVVWGIIGFRVIKYLNQDNVIIPKSEQKEIKFEPEKFQNDTFTIIANYRDPFLETTFPKKKNPVSEILSVTAKEKSKFSTTAKESIPLIVFNGFVRNHKVDKTFVLLKINGKDRMLYPGGFADGVKLLTVTRDSIRISYLGLKKVIYRAHFKPA